MLSWALVLANTTGAVPTSSGATAVQTGDTVDATSLPAPHSFRRGLVFGLSIGAGVGGASGYPNDITRINDPNYYSASGWMLGSSETLFVMGALTDYLNVGFFFTQMALRNSDWTSSGIAGGLRLETFPLALVYPRLAGLGAFAQFGIGGAHLTPTAAGASGAPTAEGTASFADVGFLYEWAFGHVLGGHFAAGPSLDYQTTWSQPFERHGLVASARVAFYGGP